MVLSTNDSPLSRSSRARTSLRQSAFKHMPVHIYGAGGLGREVLAALTAADEKVVGFIVDPGFATQPVQGLPVCDSYIEIVRDPLARFVLALGDGRVRQRVATALGANRYITLVHPATTIGPFISMGEGTMTLGPASMTTNISVGAHVLINPGCTIAHDCVLGAFATLGPGVSRGGPVVVGEGASLGVGAVVAPGVTIGAWATVGAGAVVIRDVAPETTVVGVPAHPIRRGSPRQAG